MPLKIHHPKKNAKLKQNTIIIQGKCDNSAKVTGVLFNKTAGQPVAGGQKLTKKPKQWGFRYKGLANASYKFTATQTNSPAVTDVVDFDVNHVPPIPATPPVVAAPLTGDDVGVVFYPYGVSRQNIDSVVFSGNGQNVNGVVTQQPDTDGNWTAEVDVSTCPSAAGYALAVANASGTTNVNNLTLPSA